MTFTQIGNDTPDEERTEFIGSNFDKSTFIFVRDRTGFNLEFHARTNPMRKEKADFFLHLTHDGQLTGRVGDRVLDEANKKELEANKDKEEANKETNEFLLK